MRSSGNTPSRSPRPPIRRLVVVLGDDDPKACTGRRMLRRGLAQPSSRRDPGARPIVLDPFAAEPLSRKDRATAETHGILVVDGPWNRLSVRGRFDLPAVGGIPRGPHRRLPMLVAANPQHYGRLGELNSVEALGAALYLVGRPDEAATLLSEFAGGDAFLEINRGRFAVYARAPSPAGVRRAEQRFFR